MNESKLHIYVANLLEMQVVDFDEMRAIKEAESKGFSSTGADRIAIRATGKLAKQELCRVQ